MNSKIILEKLFEKKDLSAIEIGFLFNEFVIGAITDAQMTAFLIALRMKGETVEEIIGLIFAMKERMVRFPFVSKAIDTCGTGGDGLHTFNISTTVAFVVAGCGIPVIKHGNRAASSKCGSADVLSELGIRIILTPQEAKKVFDNVGMIFLFAPLYHPAMKKIVPIREKLGTRTVFNYLGPFLNPAGVKRQIIGVPNFEIAKIMAQVAKRLGYKYLFLVTSFSGLDELDITSKTQIYEIKGKKISEKIIEPQVFGFKNSLPNEIQGGDAVTNSQIMRNILNGEKSAKRDIVLLNSAYALVVSGKVSNITEGIIRAEESIDSGAANNVLKNLIKQTQKYS